jgi:hypothetical protein
MFVCCVVRSLCDELITRPEESYRQWRVVVLIKKPRERVGHSPRWAADPEKIIIIINYSVYFVQKFSRFEAHCLLN